MKLKTLWIENFKNLQKFEISFHSQKDEQELLTTIIIGGNGTGKSNLLEALAIIFRDLDLRNRDILFEYYIKYECHNHLIEIDANPGQTRSIQEDQLAFVDGLTSRKRRPGYLNITVDGNPVTITAFYDNKANYLPKHVFGYYSGPTNRLAQLFDPHQKKFYEEQRKNIDSPLRPLFFALPVHSQFVLLAYFSFPDSEDIKFLKDYMGITDLESVEFVLKEPDWKRTDYPDDLFWGAEGVPADFLQNLYDAALAPIRQIEKIQLDTGKTADQERLYLFIKDKLTLQNVAQKRGNNQEFFKALDTLYIARLIAEVRIRVKRVGVTGDITFTELSEGEQQLLTVMGLLKFTRDTESLFLLDEPDTHLNPAWKLEYMNLIEPIVRPGGKDDDSKCQILLATHDPIVIGGSLKEQVRVLTFENGDRSKKVTWLEPEEDPRGMGIEALLTSEIYGLRAALDLPTQELLDEKRRLAAKELQEMTDAERARLKELNEQLSNLGFTYAVEDQIYNRFQKILVERWGERYEEIEKQTRLTPKQLEELDQLTHEILNEMEAEKPESLL